MAKRRYLFFDVDGTLVAGGYGQESVPPSTVRALERLREAGHFLALATGRSQAMAADYLHELGFENMVSDGGYGVTLDGELWGITPLPHDKMCALIRECDEKGFPWGLQVENSCTRFVPNERFIEAAQDVYMDSRVVPGLDPNDWPEIYKAYIACAEGEEQELETLRDLPWCRFHPTYIFVEPADKAFGIRQVMAKLDAPLDQVVVFGDALNDLSMFKDEWTCVAMGNACNEVKAKADYITTNVDDDGIWNACETLGLFEPVNEEPVSL